MVGAIERRDWHLDRRVTVALIGALLLQGGSAIWWASSMNQRMSSLESTVLQLARSSLVDVKIEALGAQIAECKRFHNRLEAKLDKVLFERNSGG